MRAVSRGTVATVAVAALLVGAGVITYLTSESASFGWFAYAPAPQSFPSFSAGSVVLGQGQVLGVALAVLGLLAGAAGLAYSAGRRRGSGLVSTRDALDG